MGWIIYIVLATIASSALVFLHYVLSDYPYGFESFLFGLLGLVWPVSLAPCLAYIAARWYRDNH